jgi:hypothetical protein
MILVSLCFSSECSMVLYKYRTLMENLELVTLHVILCIAIRTKESTGL